jgi:exonuclease III
MTEENGEPDIQDSDEENVHQETKASRNISLLHINAQSIKNKMEKLQIEAETHDIIAITETWLHEGVKDEEIAMEGYHTPIRRDRVTDRYGGVAIYCKTNLPVKPRYDIHTPEIESIWVETTLGNQKLLIGTIYRPPNEPANYWEIFSEHIELAKEQDIESIMIVGDLNCNLLLPNNKLQQILDNYHLEQLVKDPTHYTENSKTLIDIMATNSADLVKKTAVLTPSLSNHCDIVSELNTKKPKIDNHKRKIYTYDEAKWEEIRNKLRETNWNEVMRKENIDEMAELWTEKFMTIMDEHIPNKIITTSKHRAPWMTEGTSGSTKT